MKTMRGTLGWLNYAALVSAALFVAGCAAPRAPELVAPADGSTVAVQHDGQKAYLRLPREERRVKFADAAYRKEMRGVGYWPKPVEFSWRVAEGAAPDSAFDLRLYRDGDAEPVFTTNVVAEGGVAAASADNLEIGRDYRWTVADAASGAIAEGRFTTESEAPRFVRIPGVPNVRDIGGRKGLDGRRVRQGLVFRSAGLNENASPIYYTREETLANAKDPDAILAEEAALKGLVAVLNAAKEAEGEIALVDAALNGEWTLFKVEMKDADFIDKGLEAMRALDAVPGEFLGAQAKTVALDGEGRYAFSKEERYAAKGPAVFVQEFDSPADGYLALGCGADWWWTLVVNGEVAFDRSFERGNNRSPIGAGNHTFLVPVRKGRNVISAAVKTGSGGWCWCCKTLADADVNALAANAVRNAEARIEALFKTRKGMQPGKTRISDASRAVALGDLGIRSDIDLRTDGECYGMDGSPLGPEVTWFHYSSGCYRGMAEEWARKAFADVFRVFLDRGNYPIDFHCIAGQDRTGAVAFIINGLLGVEEEELYRDWEATGFWNPNPNFNHERLFDKLVKVFDEYPGDTINERIEGYVLSLGFTKDDIGTLRSIMLE